MGATTDTGTVVVVWHQRGACRGLDASIFYPDPDDDPQANRAKAVCEGCEVREACLEHALSRREPTGVWGGATELERRRITRRRRRSA
ncbi:MAG: WhiB family transcriptional regulator [Acidimicrobiales bacterium]|jgi:WhiB family redox-sensing transcriptional regulator|nr:WhiB family transcriptional regulator [Acidimicrobiales bacterium]